MRQTNRRVSCAVLAVAAFGAALLIAAPPTSQGSAPTAVTQAATDVTSSTATLNASVNPNGLATTVYFRSCSGTAEPQFFPQTSSKTLAAGNTPQVVGLRLSGLKPGLTYRFAIHASNSAGARDGACLSFTTPGATANGKPIVETRLASQIGTTSVTLNGTVNPNGLSTSYSFISEARDKSATTYFPPTNKQEAGSSRSALSVTAAVSGLYPGTTYYYKIRAKNSAGESYGEIIPFTTAKSGSAVSVKTDPATHIGDTFADLNGTLSTNGVPTTYTFTSCDAPGSPHFFAGGPKSPHPVTTNAAPDAFTVSFQATNLKPSTTYRYVFSATNSNGTFKGQCVSFKTLPAGAGKPAVTTLRPDFVSTTNATLKGTVNPSALETRIWFESCAANPSAVDYFAPTPKESVGNGSAKVEKKAMVEHLFPGQTYKYRMMAENKNGTSSGECQTFTTTAYSGITVQAIEPRSLTSTSAVLCANVNPNGVDTHVRFVCAGGTDRFDTSHDIGIGFLKSVQTVKYAVNGLKAKTVYTYRVEAWGPDGKVLKTTNASFTTPAAKPGPPSAITLDVIEVFRDGATFRGIANPNGLATTAYFEACEVYPGFFPTKAVSLMADYSNLTLTGSISGLAPDKTYRFRFVAKNSKGSATGDCLTFKTSR